MRKKFQMTMITFHVKFLLINRSYLFVVLFTMSFLRLLSLQCCMPYCGKY